MKGPVLITGADGFLGRHLTAALTTRGYPVIRHTRAIGDVTRSPFRFDHVNDVIHLAGRSYVPESWRDPLPFYEANVLGTANVLEFCRRQGAALILMSSYVYGQPLRLPVDERHPLVSFNPYAHSKILAEDGIL